MFTDGLLMHMYERELYGNERGINPNEGKNMLYDKPQSNGSPPARRSIPQYCGRRR
jgi:hypothetical protein